MGSYDLASAFQEPGSWQSPLCVYPAVSLLHSISIPAAAAVWEEARLAEGWGMAPAVALKSGVPEDSGS